MKKNSIICILILINYLTATAQNGTLPYWQDMHVLKVNKEEPRTSFMSYNSKATAQTGKYEQSPYYRLLNGTWKFYYTEDHRQLSANITDADVSTSGWSDIKVPGNWEVQGFGVPVYINHGYEFQPRNPNPPALPSAIPAGVYRRDFEIPSGWLERDIYLHIAGAKSGFYVYVNGKEVGYSEDSKNPAEFLINPYVREGNNVLTLKVFRWTTASYLECQDFFRISGIERDVFLWSQPKTALHDFRVISSLDDTYRNGIFSLALDVKNTSERLTDAKASYSLVDKSGREVATGKATLQLAAKTRGTVSFQANLPNVLTWTAEHPNLYKLLVSIENEGVLQEVVPFNVGFRRFEIKESKYVINGKKQELFFINGQAVKLKGVNIHEVSPVGGHYVTPEEMKKNFELMKLNNINSIRLSHYPQDRKFYEMCDEYGFYVYDEANIESHGMYYNLRKGGTLGNNPDWLENHLYRIRNMYERNKNYPCVSIFSLGNEAGNGYNFYQVYLWLKAKEKDLMNRPVCYERALWEWNTDMYVPQYPSAAWLREIGESGADRPIVPSEYAHAMGNSTGDLYGQWQAIYRYPHLQGGYIWEWMDHALLAHNDKGEAYWAYGGDYGKDQPSDGNFVADGLIGPDQIPHPGLTEVKYNYQNVGFEAVDLAKGKVKISNRFYFTDLSGYELTYKVMGNEKLLKSGVLNLNLKPQESELVTIPLGFIKPRADTEYFLNFEVRNKKADKLVPANHLVAYDQFLLPVTTEKTPLKNVKGPDLRLEESGNTISIVSSGLNFVFDLEKGIPVSYKVDKVEYFKDGYGIRPNFWRGPVDNDYGNGAPNRLQVWKQSSEKLKIAAHKVTKEGDKFLLEVDYLLEAGNHFIVCYALYPSGALHVSTVFTPLNMEENFTEKSEAELLATHSPQAKSDRERKEVIEVPRIGVRFHLPKEMNQVEYFGRGPEENYIDRKMGTLVGLYRTSAEEMYVPYVRPQENGHRTDTRWLKVSDGKGRGLMIRADELLEFNALRNTVEDFDSEEADAPYQWNNFSAKEIAERDDTQAKNRKPRQTHITDIKPRDLVEVCLDWRQQGVGGYDSWGSRPITEATIYADKKYKWGFTIIPLSVKPNQ